MASLLPRFIALGYRGKYLECVKGEGDSKGLVEFSGEEALSPKARFQVERALCSDELVHLKCCYRNKYLRRRSEEDDTIVAVAREPEEDQSKWSCTLFRPRPLPSESESQPLPLQQICSEFEFEMMAPPSEGGGPYYLLSPTNMQGQETEEANHNYHSYLKISSRATALAVTDAETVVQLPRYITFKADNEKYLRFNSLSNNLRHLDFEVDEEDYMNAAVFVVLPMGDGSVRLFYFFNPNHYLRFDGSAYLTLLGTSAQANDLQTRFLPVKIGTSDNSIGLKILSNNWLCRRRTGPDGTKDVLGATSSKVDAATELEVVEAVGSRSVYQINYRMEDAYLYDYAPVTSVTKDVKNESQTTQAGELTFNYTETKSETWGNMSSWGVGVRVEMKARIPFVGGTEISTGAEYEGEYEWGGAKETSTQVSTALELEVPPMSRTQVTMIVSRGTLEVPFSYTQRDTLYSGRVVVTEVDGGLFSGVNTYVSYETTELGL